MHLQVAARPRIRASDEERERTVLALHRHFAAGRLTLDELERRVDAAHAAVFRDELPPLLRDLPRDLGARAMRSFYRLQRRALTLHAAGYATASGTTVGTWALTGAQAFWPAWIVIPGAALLAWHAAGSRALRRSLEGLSPGAERRRLGPRRTA